MVNDHGVIVLVTKKEPILSLRKLVQIIIVTRTFKTTKSFPSNLHKVNIFPLVPSFVSTSPHHQSSS
jgi:hypothetical protein